MKKILPFILILSIFVNLFTPFAVVKAAPGDESNTTTATNENGEPEPTVPATPPATVSHSFYEIGLTLTPWIADRQIDLDIFSEEEGDFPGRANFGSMSSLYLGLSLEYDGVEIKTITNSLPAPGNKVKFKFTDLDVGKTYLLKGKISEMIRGTVSGTAGGTFNTSKILDINPIEISTSATGQTDPIEQGKIDIAKIEKKQQIMPNCGLFNLDGCAAQFLYGVFFVPTSFLFALAGTFFDNTFAYSVNSDSYTNPFVTKGWGLMRDFCNMFFIFVLVYIAIGTILQLNSVKTKDMMINVIVIGIFINFSLFATQVVIDTSNIIARVFYNSETIRLSKGEKTGITDAANKTAEVSGAVAGSIAGTDLNGDRRQTPSYVNGVIPLSEAIVTKINPQNLIINGGKVGTLPNKGGQKIEESSRGGISTGTFILITLLATAVNVVGMIVFLSVGLVFVTRVVGLWVAMILAPVAFFTYMIPPLQNTEMIGWKKWWPDLIKLSFLAPIFIFFLYLILQFLESGLGIIGNEDSSGINFVLGIILPFVFIMVLLMKAKSIAVKMSGDWGAAVSKIGASAGGMVLGAGVGLGALAMRGTIGKFAGRVANDEELKEKADKGDKWAKTKLRFANEINKSSFDSRNTFLGKQAQKGLGVDMTKGPKFIKPAEGGYAGAQDRKEKKREEMDKLTKPSFSTINQQNNDARMWNDKYMEEMIKAKEIAEKKGETWNEKAFRDTYEKTNPRPLNADETQRQRMSDKASRLEYGDDYIKARDEEKKKKGSGFNEYTWRKEQIEKGKIYRKNDLSERDEKLIQEYRKQGTAEKPPLNSIEKERANNAKKRALKLLDKANKELEEITKKLEKVAEDQGITEGADGVNKKHIMTELIEPKQKEIIKQESKITEITLRMEAAIKRNANKKEIAVITKELTDTQILKKEIENEMEDAKLLLTNKEKYENIKTQQTEIVKQQDDKLLNR